MKDGYTKAAMVMQNLDAVDQQWLLARLPPADKARVTTILAELTADEKIGGQKIVPDRKPDREVTQYTGVNDTDQQLLTNAKPEDIQLLLAGEPDWIVALLLAHHDWPWAPAFLERQTAETIVRLSALSQRLCTVVKPRVIREVMHACIASLPQAQPSAIAPGAFAVMLARMQQRPTDLSATDA